MNKPWLSDNWWVSEFNYLEEIRKRFNLPAKVEIHDATLRDGEQTPGVVLRKEDKVAIARKLDEVGINRIEAGMPVVSEEDFEAIKEITSLKLNARIFAFCRANVKDIEAAASCGVSGVCVEFPSGEPRLKYQFKWTEDEVIDRALKAIQRAKELGLYVTIFPYETTRANLSFLKKLLKVLYNECKYDAVAVVDTLGCALPEAISYLVKLVSNTVPVPVEIHSHNDFGLGVAGELAAVAAGASVVHGCVNGLGERTGNAPTEEIIVGLKMLFGYDLPVKFEELVSLSKLVEELSGYPVPKHKAIVGDNAFSRETSVGMDLLFSNPLAIMPIRPQFVGNSSKVLIGKKSGATSIKLKLSQLGIEVTEDQARKIALEVKNCAIAKKATLDDDELLEITSRILGSQ